MIVNPRGWQTSEAWIGVAGAILNTICQVLGAYLNQPGLTNGGRDLAILAGLYLLCRTLLKSIATATGQAAPDIPPAPVTIDNATTPKPPALSAQGGSPNGA